MNIRDFKKSLPYLINANTAVMLVGHHGVGKSQGVKQFCDENELGFVDLRLGTQDVGDILGLADFKVDDNGERIATKFMPPDWFPMDPNSRGLIFLDEINRARRDVLQAVFQLVLDKRIHTYELPKGWHVVAAMNPSTQDYIVTDLSDKAFLDRFCQIKLQPSKPEFFDYARKRDFDGRLLQFLEKQPKLLQAELEDFNVDVTPSRRSWEAVDRLVKAKTPDSILRPLVNGLVGTAAGSAFMKALNSNEQPLEAKNILKDWSKHKSKVKKYSSAKGGRMDMIKYTVESFKKDAAQRKEELTAAEKKNFSEFCLTIPKDMAFDLCREVYMENHYTAPIEENEKLLDILANARDMEF